MKNAKPAYSFLLRGFGSCISMYRGVLDKSDVNHPYVGALFAI